MQRYFVKKLEDNFILQDNDFHHIKNVMRIKNHGHIICVFENKSYLCEITYDANNYQIKIIEEQTADVELEKKIILYQALIRNEKFDLVVQKACELGVSEIYPTIFERSVVKIDNDKKDNKLLRYNKIIKEACEQSHRQTLPTFNSYINVLDITLDENTLGLIAYENENEHCSFHNALNNLNDYDKVAIVIGPEGGFSKKEVECLLKKGFKSISLGKRILRSETASLYALSVLAYKIEEM